MSETPTPGSPDHWIHVRLQGIEQALLALIEAARSQPSLNDSLRLKDAATRLEQSSSQVL